MIYKLFKSIFDRLAALFLVIITFPAQVIISICLFIELREFPLYFQKRGLTLSGKLFTIYKFKTIKKEQSDKIEHKKWNDIFLVEDQSILLTFFAKLLRRTGLDELPQFYNILFGSMSFIGPRPLMIRDLEIMKREYPREYKTRTKLKSKPGLTGLWQIIGNRNLGVENLLALDLFYDENVSFPFDLKITLLTIPLVMFAKNSDAIIPRIDFVSKFFSKQIGEFYINRKNKNHLSKDENYSLKIPVDWWYTSNTYNSSQKEKTKIFLIDESRKKNSKTG
jgi:lipopolysaccharide/colanic/teichoic acid biosynthesis glycosyltransferase